jgi:hypothetical protein
MRTLRHALAATFALAALVLPAAAAAATAAPALDSLRWVVGASSQTGEDVVIISGTLPGSVRLPARIVIPVPKGLTPGWVGEIVGSDPSKDPTAVYSTVPGPKYDTMTITLKQARVGQAEFTIPQAATGSVTSYSAEVPVLGPVGSATIEFRLPSGSVVITSSPGLTLGQSSGGVDFYSLTKKSPRRGSTVKAALTVDASTAPLSSGASGAGSVSGTPVGGPLGNVAPIIVMLVAALAGFLGVFAYFRVRDGRVPEYASEDDDAPRPDADRSRRANTRKRPKQSEQAVGFEDEDAPPPDDQAPREAKTRKRPKRAEPVVASESAPEAEQTGSSVRDDVTERDVPVQAPVTGAQPAPLAPADDAAEIAPAVAAPEAPANDIIGGVKRLATLKADGLLDEEEFALAKQGLLAGDTLATDLLADLARFRATGLLSDEEFGTAKEQLLTGSTEMIVEIEELVGLQEQGLLSREEFRIVVDRLLND